jgi:hypothetical protein
MTFYDRVIEKMEKTAKVSPRRRLKAVGHYGAAAFTGAAGLHADQALTRKKKKKGHEKKAEAKKKKKKKSVAGDIAKGALLGAGAGAAIRGGGEALAAPFTHRDMRLRGVKPGLARKLTALRVGQGAAAGIPLGVGIMLLKHFAKKGDK